ncbi:MAG: hypothetical protein MUD02_02905 [Bacteroidales bacterium]|jgi:hypothetical protein|nr:hypothetical protein [Bacteroidales bacterium]MCU0407875.1 hypothetical protein [Bacteroidales bacterium]
MDMLVAVLITMFSFLHPVHVSLTSVDYNNEKGMFDVFMRLYYDDFVLDSTGSPDVAAVLPQNADTVNLRKEMEIYLGSKFNILADNRELRGQIGRIRISDNEISMNLEYELKRSPSRVLVRNTIMTTLYSDMANMLILRVGAYEKAVKLTPENTEAEFNIK